MTRSLAERASFRDHAGRVEERGGELWRVVDQSFVESFGEVVSSGLYDELRAAKLLVGHGPVLPRSDGGLEFAPERVPFISYPYEWTPRQLQHAALLTLDVAARAHARGFCLRDASAHNVQFHRGHPIFIDSLSFVRREPGSPWLAYGQFCRHFLAPLALASLIDPAMIRLSAQFADGIPLRTAARLLGRRGMMRSGVLVHVHLHALAERRASHTPHRSTAAIPARRVSQLLDGLRSTIDALPFDIERSAWSSYEGGSHYAGAARTQKDGFVDRAVAAVRPASLWDLGANTGDAGFRNVPHGGYALAVEADLACAEACYARARFSGAPVATIWTDLLCPTPAVGWANEERASLTERGPTDIVLALALLHHLCISGRVPLARVVDWLAQICRHAVVEVPERHDPMVQSMLRDSSGQLGAFGCEAFRALAATHFDVLAEEPLDGLARTMFFLRRRV